MRFAKKDRWTRRREHELAGMWSLIYLAVPLPAVCLGALLMDRHGVSSGLWLQQIGAALIGTVSCFWITIAPPRSARLRGWDVAAAPVAVGLVAATLAFPGLEGVRRWIPVGPLQLHASAVALPILLLALGAAGRDDPSVAQRTRHGFALVAAVLLIAQPDASQATAFGGAATALLLLQARRSAATWLTIGFLGALAAVAWTRPDPLSPVPHVEQIVDLAAQTGALWHAAAIGALALLPLPFVVAATRGSVPRGTAVAVAIYFGILCIAPSFGAYPVPLMGFGLSAVLGYYVALGWLVVRDRHGFVRPLSQYEVPPRRRATTP